MAYLVFVPLNSWCYNHRDTMGRDVVHNSIIRTIYGSVLVFQNIATASAWSNSANIVGITHRGLGEHNA